MHQMRCLKWPVVLVLVAIGLMFASVAMADDFNPPPNLLANWNRANPLATTYEWDFNSHNIAGIAPDGAIPPTPADGGGGGPLAIPGPNIVPGAGTWTGGPTAALSRITFLLPNWVDEQAYKWVWAQITFVDGGNGSPSLGFVDAFDPADPTVTANFLLATEDATDIHRTEIWQLFPNPDWEVFQLNVPQGTVIDQVIFDTVSAGGSTIPEPSTYALFGMGALMLIGWNRRRRQQAA